MIPAYITFVANNNRSNTNTNIADDTKMSSINGNGNGNGDEYRNYDKDLNQSITANVIQDVITNLNDDDDDDDDTMETII